MNRAEAITWVLTVCAQLRLSQAQTLADLVGAALYVGRVSLTAIGRQLLAPAAKHRIKRTWRFVANPRIEVADATLEVVGRLVGRCKKPLLIGFD